MFDLQRYPYPSRRSCVVARRGMVATQHPLAAQVGLRILQQGGNAVDAAVATAAALTVLEPTSNGIGGDAFAIVWSGGRLHGLNASGPAPRLLTLDALRRDGYDTMPRTGFAPVTVPGAPAAWVQLNQRFGRLPLLQVLAPAIEYAAEGFPVSPTVARLWQAAAAPVYSAAWRETNNGVLAGMPNDEAERLYPGLYFRTLGMDERYPGGESPRENFHRIREAFTDLCRRTEAGEVQPNVLLLTHGGVISIICHLIKGMEWTNKSPFFPAAYTSIHTVAYVDGRWELVSENATPHLKAE